jgi:hypothetical protein
LAKALFILGFLMVWLKPYPIDFLNFYYLIFDFYIDPISIASRFIWREDWIENELGL